MFQLRPEHLDAFTRAARERFEESLAASLAQRHPLHVARHGDRFPRFVHEAVDRSMASGIVIEEDVASFVELNLLWEEVLSSKRLQPEVERVLQDPILFGEEKVNQLWELYQIQSSGQPGSNHG